MNRYEITYTFGGDNGIEVVGAFTEAQARRIFAGRNPWYATIVSVKNCGPVE